MNKIYFANKGSTVKAGVEYLWPTRQLTDTPREFLEETKLQGLFAFIQTTHIKKTHYEFAICIVNAADISWRYLFHQDAWCMSYPVTAYANYEKGRLDINLQQPADKYTYSANNCDNYWALNYEALELIREATAEIDKYFTAAIEA